MSAIHNSDTEPLLRSTESSSRSPSRSKAYSRLAAARSYGTFLLFGMSSEPAVVHIPSKGKGRAVKQDEDNEGSSETSFGAGSKWTTILSWLNQDLQLQNVGSVARDHLANERTFLAWLRTSLSLASIGVGKASSSVLRSGLIPLRTAITQLFRLSSSTYTLPSGSQSNLSGFSLPDPSTTVSEADLTSVVSSLLVSLGQQQVQLEALATSTARERQAYTRLGKPIGGTFILLGLIMLVTGEHRSAAHQAPALT